MATATPVSRSGPIAPDLVSAAKQADLLALLPGLRRWARTSGGEYHGPCPRCGGQDRLIAWPQHPKGPRALCRQCHDETMDTIALVQWLGKATDFRSAVELLAGPAARYAAPAAAPAAPEPPRPYRPPHTWQRITARYRYYAPAAHTIALADLRRDMAGTLAAYDALPKTPHLAYMKERREPGYHGKPKTFYHAHPRPGVTQPDPERPGDWYEGRGNPADLWPYNWPAALALADGAPLLWVDGEKDVRTAHAAGLVAVCGPDGGRSWQEQWGALFCGLHAIIIPDRDPDGEGEQQARRAADLIYPYAASVKIVPVPAGKDLTDWLHELQGVSHVA